MNNVRKSDPLAAAVAVLLAGTAVTPAAAQTGLDVYSDDFSGGASPAPAGAVPGPAVFDMHIERLHVVKRGIAALRSELDNHSHPPHNHPPHVHVSRTGVSGTVGGGDGGPDTVTVYSMTDRPGALETSVVHSSAIGPNGRVSIGQHTYTSKFSESNRGTGGDGGGDGY